MNKLFRIFMVVMMTASLVIAPLAGVQAQGSGPGELAPLSMGQGDVIPNQYIVVLKPGSGMQAEMVSALGGQMVSEFGAALNGFNARLTDKALLALRKNPQVAYIEADQVISLGPLEQADIADAPTGEVSIESVQASATWGLDRIDQHALPLSTSYTYNKDGSGVNVYILDTGIRASHGEFTGRATKDLDVVNDGQNGEDCNGHGTHVAGTIGSVTYGVAKAANLHSVRVLNCSGDGSTSGVIAGINWVIANHVHPAVVNMSLAGYFSNAINNAVQAASQHGILVVAAAGNDNADACQFSPASTQAAITVGATDANDARASFSNWGSCLDIFAPGSGITSTWHTSDFATNTISGTSMAAPHVTGVAALYLQAYPGVSPAATARALVNFSTKNVLQDPLSPINRLLYSLESAVPFLVSPGGLTTDTTPSFVFSKVPNAMHYEISLYKGPALVYTIEEDADGCGDTENCADTPSQALSMGNYSWKVRAMVGDDWGDYSPAMNFTVGLPATIPTPLGPKAAIYDRTPSFTWSKVTGASLYQYLLYKAGALVSTRQVTAAQCGTSGNCVNTPTTALTAGNYTWKVRAKIGNVWKVFSPLTAFKLISNFDSQFTSNAAGWTALNGDWKPVGGYYKGAGIAGLIVSSVHADNYETFTYEVKMKRTGCASCDNILYFRGAPGMLDSGSGDWANGYEVGLSNDGHYYIGYQKGGVWTYVQPWTSSSAITNSWNTVKVSMNHTFLQVYINGTLVSSGHVTAFTTGRVGVGFYKSGSSPTDQLAIDYAKLSLTAPAAAGLSAGAVNFDLLDAVDQSAPRHR